MILTVGWTLWLIPFAFSLRQNRPPVVKVDTSARWGIAIVFAAFLISYPQTSTIWISPISPWRAVLSLTVALFAMVLAWSALLVLGPQWRFGAVVCTDHQLIKDGPYRLVRHPIYLSMFCMLQMVVILVGTPLNWLVSTALFVLGTKIRVRAEDRLLLECFGAEYAEWQRRIPAYLPFAR